MDCRIPQDKIASHLLNTCSNMEHVSFSHGSTPLDVVEYIQLPTKQDFYTSDIKCWSLTYLKLSFTYYTNNDQLTDHDCIHNEQLGRLLSQCPNLKHLFMDSGGTIHHGNCLDQILKHCHRLETLVISPNADFPSDCSDNKHITSTTQRPGLRQLVLSGKHLRITNTDMISVYKQHYETLEMIYLYFHSIDEITRSLVKLAHTKAPRLQQLYLLTDNNFIPISIHKLGYPSINKALVTLLSGGCPLLNTIHIINNDFDYSMPESKYNGDNYFSISDKVLKAIATGCRELHTLKFPGPRRYTKKGLMHFATTGVKKLVELEMDIIPEHILEVVIRIESLQKLIFSGSNTSLPDDIQNALSEILQKRIGIASHLTE
ncbi:hypothetical protein BDA99DRAFT_309469 [Phascolomyces articulosus]|uniref:Uncharacterized protein n=1 Tax=Phascolomyces articulosus TaxID=60185 RepID=A0AAD5P7K1_9FUNG|nr:hypothetical protein BDA99DRAFT_309469 [Phascolomyces articulosus]